MSKYDIGIPKEVKHGEKRVALTPYHVQLIRQRTPATVVYIETLAGEGAGFSDKEYEDVGAKICSTKKELYESAKFIVKVKEPLDEDLQYINSSHILFCYFHLAANPTLTKKLLGKKITAIAFESVTQNNRYFGSILPLLAPMSIVAGKLAIHMAHDVLRSQLGEMIMINTQVHIIGAGNVGKHALATACGLGASVTLYDVSRERVASTYVENYESHVTPHCLGEDPSILSTKLTDPLNDISIVVCGALIRDDKAPHVITREMLKTMNGPEFCPTIFVDVSIDQGGCIEGIKQTNLTEPWYKEGKHYFIAVPNMPGSVPHTSSYMLGDAIWEYVSLLSGTIDTSTLHIREDIVEKFEALSTGIILKEGRIVNETLKTLFGSKGELIS